MGWFDFLQSEEVDLAPAMRAALEPDQSQPDDVQLRAWMGREKRSRQDLRDQESSLYAGWADAPADEVLGLRAYEGAHDRCMEKAERRAALACLQGRLPGQAAPRGMTPEACMEAWRDGRVVTGGSSGSSSGTATTDSTSSGEALEVSGGMEVTPVPKITVGGKANANQGRNHSDTSSSGTSSSTSWAQGRGYMATCDAEASAAENAAIAAHRAQERNILDAIAIRDAHATPWKGAVKP